MYTDGSKNTKIEWFFKKTKIHCHYTIYSDIAMGCFPSLFNKFVLQFKRFASYTSSSLLNINYALT